MPGPRDRRHRRRAEGAASTRFDVGDRVGVPWLGWTCGDCALLPQRAGRTSATAARFTGYQIDGGYAEYTVADERYLLSASRPAIGDVAAAPLLCAGLIGYRALRLAGDGRAPRPLRLRRRRPHRRPGRAASGPAGLRLHPARRRRRRRSSPASSAPHWAGGSDELPPEPLDAAIIFAPVGALVPAALAAVAKGGTVVCAGIHMSDIPSFPYAPALGGARASARSPT